jgi:hypothetical protein
MLSLTDVFANVWSDRPVPPDSSKMDGSATRREDLVVVRVF